MTGHDNRVPDRSWPWCDTCRRVAIWSESHGWQHADRNAPNDHEVTATEWNNQPAPEAPVVDCDHHLAAEVARLGSELATYKQGLVESVTVNAALRKDLRDLDTLAFKARLTRRLADDGKTVERLTDAIKQAASERANAAANEASLDHVTQRLADALNLNEVPLDDMLHTVAGLTEQRDVAHDHRGELLVEVDRLRRELLNPPCRAIPADVAAGVLLHEGRDNAIHSGIAEGCPLCASMEAPAVGSDTTAESGGDQS